MRNCNNPGHLGLDHVLRAAGSFSCNRGKAVQSSRGPEPPGVRGSPTPPRCQLPRDNSANATVAVHFASAKWPANSASLRAARVRRTTL
eukprot:2150403-Prymnesium_polylepis.1